MNKRELEKLDKALMEASKQLTILQRKVWTERLQIKRILRIRDERKDPLKNKLKVSQLKKGEKS